MANFNPPPLPPGYDKHHIVNLEAVHVPLPDFNFPHTITHYQQTPASEIASRVKDATIVITNVADVTPSDMSQAPSLQLLAVMATGMGWVDKPWCAANNITVVNCPQSNVAAVTEHVLALYFASRKRVPEVDRRARESEAWRDRGTLAKIVWPDGPPLGCAQETLGIIGYGALGRNVERVCRVLGFKEILISERKNVSDVRQGRVAFDQVIRKSTTMVVLVPREPDTVDMISDSEFDVMRKDALLINVARGGIVNEAALARALRERKIFGAATDVFEQEPCSYSDNTSPLIPNLVDNCQNEEEKWKARVPNLIVSSHVAWFSGSTIVTLQKLLKDGIEGFVKGRLHDDHVKGSVAVHEGKIWK